MEHAGFRKGFGTENPLLGQIQNTEKKKQPLCLRYVEYEKAFDTIRLGLFWNPWRKIENELSSDTSKL